MFTYLSLIAAASGVASVTRPIYFVRDGDIFRHSTSGDQKIISRGNYPAISPNGKKLAFIRNEDLYVYGLDSHIESRKTFFRHDSDRSKLSGNRTAFPSWDPNGECILCSHLDALNVKMANPPQAAIHFLPFTDRPALWSVYWYRINSGQGNAKTVSFLSNSTSASNFFLSSTFGASFSPQGDKVAFCRNGDLWMANLNNRAQGENTAFGWTEQRVWALANLDGNSDNWSSFIFRISWSPSGSKLAVYSDEYRDGVDKITYIVDVKNPANCLI